MLKYHVSFFVFFHIQQDCDGQLTIPFSLNMQTKKRDIPIYLSYLNFFDTHLMQSLNFLVPFEKFAASFGILIVKFTVFFPLVR